MNIHFFIPLLVIGIGLVLAACAVANDPGAGKVVKADSSAPTNEPGVDQKVVRSDVDWCSRLTPEQYAILRGAGTERPFQNAFWNNHEPGVYRCAGCGLALFNAGTKFDSGTGWPSFYQPVATDHVKLVEDDSFGMKRIEVLCPRCGSHLGHLFDDGPAPTGKRFCINSGALTFEKAK